MRLMWGRQWVGWVHDWRCFEVACMQTTREL